MDYNQNNNFDPTSILPSWFRNNRCYDIARTCALEISSICKERLGKNDPFLSGYLSQISRSSSSVLANLSESLLAESGPMRTHNMNVVIKEANETISWCIVLLNYGTLSQDEYRHFVDSYTQIVHILNKSIATIKSRQY